MESARLPARAAADQRVIEGWLPLAAAANARYGWRLSPVAIESLVRQAAPRLGQAESALAAHAVLWAAYRSTHPDEHRP